MVRACGAAAVQPPALRARVRAPQITKGPQTGGSGLIHMLWLSFAVGIANARNRLYNMLCKQIGKMIFVQKD